MEWIINNKEWIFSGIGVTIISLVIGWLLKNKLRLSNETQTIEKTKMTQKSGKNSVNIQIKGNCSNGK